MTSEEKFKTIESFYQANKLRPHPLGRWRGVAGRETHELTSLHERIVSLARQPEEGSITDKTDFEAWVDAIIEVIVGQLLKAQNNQADFQLRMSMMNFETRTALSDTP